MRDRRSKYRMATLRGGSTEPRGSITAKIPKPVDPASESLFKKKSKPVNHFKKIIDKLRK